MNNKNLDDDLKAIEGHRNESFGSENDFVARFEPMGDGEMLLDEEGSYVFFWQYEKAVQKIRELEQKKNKEFYRGI